MHPLDPPARVNLVSTALCTVFLTAALALAGIIDQVSGQASVSVMLGANIPAGRFAEVTIPTTTPAGFGADTVEYKRSPAEGVALSFDYGMLRVSGTYAFAAGVKARGARNLDDAGTSSVLALSAGVVLRQLPRIAAVQPYVVAGAGIKHHTFSPGASAILYDGFEGESAFALHAGLGAELTLDRRLGVVVELSDFLSPDNLDKWKTHDALATAGLRMSLF